MEKKIIEINFVKDDKAIKFFILLLRICKIMDYDIKGAVKDYEKAETLKRNIIIYSFESKILTK